METRMERVCSRVKRVAYYGAPSRVGGRRAAGPGITMIEVAMVIAVLLTLAAFAFVSFGTRGESSDAGLVQSAQASLQSIVSQGALRMDTRPDRLPPDAVLIAVQSALGESGGSNAGVRFTNSGNQYVMTIDRSRRSAIFDIAANGDVRLVGLNNFPNYTVDRSHDVWSIKKIP
jgi:hypothetical protein